MNREKRNQLIVQMRQDGATLQKIGDVVGLSHEGVRLILISAGEHQPYSPASWEEIEAAHRRVTQEDSDEEAEAIRVGVTPRSFRLLCRRRGLSFKGQLVRDTPALWQHGKRQAYNYGCRCELCTEALRVYIASLKGKAPPSHGASGYSNYGCRCDVCKAAHSEKMRSPRHKMLKDRSKRRVYLRNLAQQTEQS